MADEWWSADPPVAPAPSTRAQARGRVPDRFGFDALPSAAAPSAPSGRQPSPGIISFDDLLPAPAPVAPSGRQPADWWSADPAVGRAPVPGIISFDDLPRAPQGASFNDRWANTVQRAGPSASAIAADVGKQAVAGVTAGVAGLPGILGDVQQYLDSVARQNPAVNQAKLAQMRSGYTAPTSAATIAAAERAGGFKLPEAETVPGEYARTIGGFAPNILGGPGGIASRLITRAVIPGAASEAAGRLAEGTGYEGPARLIGGLAGGVGGSLAARVAHPGPIGPPSVSELKDASRAGYRAPEVAAVQIKPQAVSDLGTTIESDLVGAGFRERTTPKTFGVVGELDVPHGVQSVGVADLDSARRALGVIAKERDIAGAATAEAAAASRAIGHIDQFLPNLRQADLLAGDAAQANAILGEARGNWGAAKRSELVQTKIENARKMAESQDAGNVARQTRAQLRGLELNDFAKAGGWSPEAKEALTNVVEGTPGRNLLREAGRFAPTGPFNAALHGVAALSTGGATLPLAVAAGSSNWRYAAIANSGQLFRYMSYLR